MRSSVAGARAFKLLAASAGARKTNCTASRPPEQGCNDVETWYSAPRLRAKLLGDQISSPFCRQAQPREP